VAEIYKRIQKFINVEKLTPSELAQKIKDKPQRIRDIQSGKQKVPEDVLIKIVKIFNINATWLLIGQGEMYNNAQSSELNGKTIGEIDEQLEKLKPEQREKVFGMTLEMIKMNELEEKVERLLKDKGKTD
jgi:ribosome-binding protein aMBF1 (putative translation factor)